MADFNETKPIVGRLIIMLVAAVALALVASVAHAPATARATGPCAGGAEPCIEFQASFRLANGSTFIGGPAGTQATVIGGGFGAVNGQTISLGAVQGDNLYGASPNPAFCSQAHVTVASGIVVGGGSLGPNEFTTTFTWPAGMAVGNWSICAYNAAGAPAISGGNTDNASFDCVSPNAPTLNVSPALVTPGSVVTVTGQGWLPAQNAIVVEIESCSSCQPIARYGNAISDNSGSFSVPLTIPASTAFGSYFARGLGNAVPLDTGTAGPQLTVAATDATPTATPRPAPTATPRPAPTSTPKVGATATARPKATGTATASALTAQAVATATPATAIIAGGADQTGSGGASFPWWAVAVLLVLLAGGGAGGFYLLRVRRMALAAAGAAGAMASPLPSAPLDDASTGPDDPTQPRLPAQ